MASGEAPEGPGPCLVDPDIGGGENDCQQPGFRMVTEAIAQFIARQVRAPLDQRARGGPVPAKHPQGKVEHHCSGPGLNPEAPWHPCG